jgi:hypothetical protein
MKNIHVIPTDKPSRLRYFDSKLEIMWLIPKKSDIVFQNIYITSDEDLKAGDWTYNIVSKTIFTAKQELIDLTNHPNVTLTTNKKIILTTDLQLIADGVQAIDNEFLEWFVKNPSCEEVEVDKGYRGVNLFNYKIIIPKEELHSMDDEVECNMCGGYMYLLPDNSMYVCTNSECTRCYEEEDEEPEQETLEEAKQEQKQHLIDLMRLDEQGTLEEIAANLADPNVCKTENWIAGAKWQAKQMYSEDEVFNLWNWLNDGFIIRKSLPTKEELLGWFEQFKKNLK